MPQPEILELSPSYHLSQPLPGGAAIFDTAKGLADDIFADKFNLVERQIVHGGIPFDNDATLSGFTAAVPETKFSTYDMRRLPATRYAAATVLMSLRDATNPERSIHLAELDNRGLVAGDFLIIDTHPMRKPRSAQRIQRDDIYRMLELQLWAPDDPPKDSRLSLHEMAEFLGTRATQYNEVREVGATSLPGSPIFHAERDMLFDPNDMTETPASISYSSWVTAETPDQIPAGVTGLKVRTVARFDGKNLKNPNNALTFEVDADEMDDETATVLTRRFKLSARAKKAIVSNFVDYLEDCKTSLHTTPES